MRQAGGRLAADVATTLDVWDAKLSQLGELLAQARQALCERLQPLANGSYENLAGGSDRSSIGMTVVTEWRKEDGGKGLAETLAATRSNDVARGATTTGPHRDDVLLTIGGLPARTHASQGEQRSLALSLRLAGHALLTEISTAPPLLLLDDVFSELDAGRSAALLDQLPAGQTFLTTATGAPSGWEPALAVRVENGSVL